MTKVRIDPYNEVFNQVGIYFTHRKEPSSRCFIQLRSKIVVSANAYESMYLYTRKCEVFDIRSFFLYQEPSNVIGCPKIPKSVLIALGIYLLSNCHV